MAGEASELGCQIIVLFSKGCCLVLEAIGCAANPNQQVDVEVYETGTYGSPLSSKRVCCCSTASMPSRKDSRDLEMWPSWELGWRFRDIARCRSSSESLMWSAKRYSCDGFAMVLLHSLVLDGLG